MNATQQIFFMWGPVLIDGLSEQSPHPCTALQRPEKKVAFHSKAGLKVSDMKSAKRVDRLQVEFCPRNNKWPRAHCKSTTTQNFAQMKALFGLLCLKLG